MPRYEIVAHVARHLDCDTAEDAAAIVRRQLLAEAGERDRLLHLAVWRQDGESAASAVPVGVRQRLVDFFAALAESAGEAEAAFRGRVEALLASDDRDRIGNDAREGNA